MGTYAVQVISLVAFMLEIKEWNYVAILKSWSAFSPVASWTQSMSKEIQAVAHYLVYEVLHWSSAMCEQKGSPGPP